MTKTELRVVFQKRVKVFYPFLTLEGLLGKRKLSPEISPFNSWTQFAFRMDEVTVSTIPSDETEEINLTIYEGSPDNNISPQELSAAGLIKVGDQGLTIDTGGQTEAVLPWPEGITAVYVVLNIDEVLKKEVRTVTFYIRHLGKDAHKQGIWKILGL